MITPPLVMVDLDNSFDRATRTITDPQSEHIVNALNSYTEVSPTNGLHVLAYGQLPGKGIHTGIEIYGQDRFTTITTDRVSGTPSVDDNQKRLILEFGDFGIVELFLLNLKWLLKQRYHLETFA